MIRKCTITSNDNWIAKHVGHIELLFPRVASLKMTVCRRVSGEGCPHRSALPSMVEHGNDCHRPASFRRWTVKRFDSLSGATADVHASLFCQPWSASVYHRCACLAVGFRQIRVRNVRELLPFPRDMSLCSAEDRDFQGEEWLDHLHFAQKAMRSRLHTVSRDERGP